MLNIFRNIYLVTICQFASEEHLFHFFFKSWGRFLAIELNSLYILDVNLLSDEWSANIFSHPRDSLFTLLILALAVKKFLV